ncbi:MAG: alpha-amylase/4-alpha-glucanotransferase domain-containing protein [Candidatus Edwardsbacteria bacterium]
MKTINFLFGVHNHQPIGNFDYVFEQAYQKAYLPFLKELERHPKVKVTFHYSGCLWEWLDRFHPDFFSPIQRLLEIGQIELIGGGFYEPILPVIPEIDRQGQIKMMNDFLKRKFDIRPKGFWLAERVWEPHLPFSIVKGGLEYTAVDDWHFKSVGLEEKNLFGYYLTEEEGETLKIFPISQKLRYLVPFHRVEETIDFFRQWATEDGERAAILADDGEKFGIWPGTYEHCYQKGWLSSFFTVLEQNSNWLEVLTFSEYAKRYSPLGRIYLPTTSYAEMGEWALPPAAHQYYEELVLRLKDENAYERYGPFVKGGFWRNFLAKYPEANHLHKRMLQVSQRLASQTFARPIASLSDTPARDEKAKIELLRSQCNCAYWHGVFGGLYLPHLRSAIYQHLITAEKILDQLRPSTESFWIESKVDDFNGDGEEEIIIETKTIKAIFSPAQGGNLIELDYKPTAQNLLDTLTRRKESYHKKILQSAIKESRGVKFNAPTGEKSIHEMVLSKEEGLEKFLQYDWYQRVSLIDHFFGEGTTLEDFSHCQYPEQGDFVNQRYDTEIMKSSEELQLNLLRKGNIWSKEKRLPLQVEKKIKFSKGQPIFTVNYAVTNLNEELVALWFGVEFNYAFSGEGEQKNQFSSEEKISEVHLKLENLVFSLFLEKEANLWRFPIETISQSEAGFERIYQSSVFCFHWKFSLEPQETWDVALKQEISHISNFLLPT